MRPRRVDEGGQGMHRIGFNGLRTERLAIQRIMIGTGLSALTSLLALMFLFPFIWTVSSSLKGAMEVQAYPPRLFPKKPQ